MKKIILLKGQVETLEYFSKRLKIYLLQYGYSIFVYDISMESAEQTEQLEKFTEYQNTVFITFNFNGISGETGFLDSRGELFFDAFMVTCINIVVDHPVYYYKYLKKPPLLYKQICIDRDHKKYMEKYYKNIKNVYFIPSGGTCVNHRISDGSERSMDVVFTGNFTPVSTFEKYITRIDDEYTKFYTGIIDDLICNPEKTIEETFSYHIIRETGNISDEEMKEVHSNMTFIDLYVRFYFREKAVRSICDSGIKIHTIGAGYDLMKVKHPENIISHGSADSKGCLMALSDAKIALNVMPWFKDGAHDRIFNSMLNGAVSLSDDSRYLREVLKNGENIMFYDLKDVDHVGDIAQELITNVQKTESIRENAYGEALQNHEWKERCVEIVKVIEDRI